MISVRGLHVSAPYILFLFVVRCHQSEQIGNSSEAILHVSEQRGCHLRRGSRPNSDRKKKSTRGWVWHEVGRRSCGRRGGGGISPRLLWVSPDVGATDPPAPPPIHPPPLEAAI